MESQRGICKKSARSQQGISEGVSEESARRHQGTSEDSVESQRGVSEQLHHLVLIKRHPNEKGVQREVANESAEDGKAA